MKKKRWWVIPTLMGIFTFLLSGCSPVPSDPRAVLEQKAAAIDSTTQDLFEMLHDVGLDDASANGSVDACQSQPAPGVSYRAGMGVKVGEDLAPAFKAFTAQLTAKGWEETDAYADVEVDPAKPMGRYAKGDITVDVKTGGFSSGGTQYGADEMQIGITIKDYCVRVPDGGYISKVEDLEKDILPRS